MCVGSMYTTTFFFNLVKSFLLSQMEPISDARLCDVTFITLQKILFEINAVLLNFLFIKVSWKKYSIMDSTKMLSNTTF